MPEALRFLALAPRTAEAALTGAADRGAFEIVHVTRLPELFERLAARPWTGTLLSLSLDGVDEAVVAKVASQANAGALLLSAGAVSLQVALLGRRVGSVAMLSEPLRDEDVLEQLGRIGDEGPDVALPELEDGGDGTHRLVGSSPAMLEVFDTIARVADSNATVLLTGESGTGKEVVARAIHDASRRADGPFVPVNCAAIPEQLLESELFGHEKGAFTDATDRRRGRFQRADGGTLFLDEIGDMSLVLQAKLLRVLESGSVEPLGGESPVPVDVRAVAATNHDLSDAIEAGRFREDLYYRLAVVELAVPPLRDRGDDLRRLALYFAALFAERHEREIRAVSRRALERLRTYAWPGNVRELRNVMDRAVMLCHGDVIKSSTLRLGPASPSAGPRGSLMAEGYPLTASLADVEADHIGRVLRSVGGHLSNAAEILGIHRNTLSRKVREYGITVPDEEAS